jgi:tetratricopeptide (TPR) repeat protein
MVTSIYRFSLVLLLWCGAVVTVARAQVSATTAKPASEQSVEDGNKYAQARQYDQAVDAYRQAIKLDPNLAAAYRGLGGVYVNMGRAADALGPLRTAVRLEPNHAFGHVNLAIALENLRRFDEALAELNEAKGLNSKDPRIYNELGNLLNNFLGRTRDALNAYQEALRLNPEDPVLQHNVGLSLLLLGRASEAVGPLQEALRLQPQYRNARYLLSDAYGKLGLYEQAIDSWSKFLKIAPNGPEALTKRAWNYLYAGGHEREAAADARQYLDVHGWRTQISTYMAIIAYLGYSANGMEQEAQAILDEAATKVNAGAWPYPVLRYLKKELGAEDLLSLATDNDKRTEAHAYMGVALRLKGDREETRIHFEWVKKYGNKRFFEYPLAIEELRRMAQ